MSGSGDSVIAEAEFPRGIYFWSAARGLSGKPQNPAWIDPTTGSVHDVAIDTKGAYMAAVNDIEMPHYVYFLSSGGALLWSYELDNPSFDVSISGDGSTLAVGTGGGTTGYSNNRAVGGVVTSTNKLEIIAPYLALAGLVAAVSAVVVVKKRSKD